MLEKILLEKVLRAMIVVSLILCSPGLLFADSPSSSGGNPTIEAKTSSMRHMLGFLPLHWDAKAGRLYLEIPQLNVVLDHTAAPGAPADVTETLHRIDPATVRREVEAAG
jgi:hypothetical protein